MSFPFLTSTTSGWSYLVIPLRAEADDLYSLVFDLSADSHEGKELAMNAMTNAQLWYRRLEHLNKRSLELMQRRDGDGVAFDGLINHCDVCTVGKSHQLAHPKKAKNADITALFQLVYGDLINGGGGGGLECFYDSPTSNRRLYEPEINEYSPLQAAKSKNKMRDRLVFTITSS